MMRGMVALTMAALTFLGGAACAETTQKEIAAELGSLAEKYSVELDKKGNVIRFGASNHGMYRKKDAEPAPGIDDEAFRAILQFPKLQAIFLERQPLTDEGYALLAECPELVDVRLHDAQGIGSVENEKQPHATADFALVVNKMKKPLRVLELKHLFKIKGTCIDKFEPQPELRKLELDNAFSGPKAVEFIRRCTKLENLQLHRTTMTDAELGRALEPLENLQVLEIRPTGRGGDPITGRSLRHVRDHPTLISMHMSIKWGEMPYEGGLEHLAGIPTLKHIKAYPDQPELTPESPQIQRLHQERPDITIELGKAGTIEGTAGVDIHRDQDYRWGITR